MEDLGELAPLVQILDLPVPQLVDNVVDALRIPERPMAVQVVEVPKILVDIIPQRSVDLVPQMAEQLVEVPTVLSPTRIALRIAEQIVDIPVPRGRGQGSLPQDRVQQRRLLLWNAFLSGLWSRSLAFLLLVVAWDAGLPHLLVLQMRILLGGFRTFPHGKSTEYRAGGECAAGWARQLIHAERSSNGSCRRARRLRRFQRVGQVACRRNGPDLLLEQTVRGDLLARAGGCQGRLDGREE